MTVFPLTKGCDPADFVALAPELAVVDAHFTAASEQHPMRRWEYALALRAWTQWVGEQAPVRLRSQWYTLDVGGAGSPFPLMLPESVLCLAIDPLLNCAIESAMVGVGTQDAVFSISTLEHVEAPVTFLKAIHRALAPGGLLFLTFDYTDTEGPDTFHFHWMRRRIYTRESRHKLYRTCKEELGFRLYGAHDWAPHGAQVYDYTFSSLCLQKGV